LGAKRVTLRPGDFMRWFLSALLAAAAVMSFAQNPGRIQVEHDIKDEVIFAIMLQQNLDLTGGGTSYPYQFSGSGSFENPFDQGTEAGIVTLLGIYEDSTGSMGVSTMVSQAFANNAVGKNWEDVFTGQDEGTIKEFLLTLKDPIEGTDLDSVTSLLYSFFESNISAFAKNGEDAAFLHFSVGSQNGTGKWTQQPVPEPSAMLILGAGAGLALLRRKAKTA
jgi:hypothetical protein